ncbi:hypothetical protein POJ06DRAFT_253969 [Lipomyces tetrasporus]|uniref:Glycosyltransferase family 4 protein n=1 Tax=Lipomyces tetrasporus TaxID=54092 RepID=A0AAD7QRE5_9ASCO|nr:uncharacterized protein POJ06DRAFT_253969 [Lipomyces tetrasporus]KAJ8099576.1 hypothetical protein POJ06DRAFT_253969 [Lipomyces tetrasporus]
MAFFLLLRSGRFSGTNQLFCDSPTTQVTGNGQMRRTTDPQDSLAPEANDESQRDHKTVSKPGFTHDEIEFPSILRGKHVLLATESFGPVNGVSRTTASLVQYLRAHSVQVAVVAPEYKGQTSRTDKTDDCEVRLSGYPLPYDTSLAVVYPFRIDKLFERTFQQLPDVIYLASPASLGFQILLQLRQLNHQLPVLLNFQTDLSAYIEILFPVPLSYWGVWAFRFVQGYLFSHPSVRTIFFPSRGVREYLESAGVPSSKLLNLRRGVNTDLFNPQARSPDYRKQLAPNNEILLVCVARLAAEKGFEFLAEVVRSLVAKRFHFKLLIVGGNCNPNVEKEVHDLFIGLANYVVFSGFLQGDDLARAYASADIFLHCSITETFGLVVLEAMASGIPVVARDMGGPSEIVDDRKSGYLVEPTDLDDFVARVEMLGREPELRMNMGRRGRDIACQATWERINNRVAWQIANALPKNTTPIKFSNRPVLYSLTSLLLYMRVTGQMGIICGVWFGLIVTWILVKSSLLLKANAMWVRHALGRIFSR